LLKERTDHLENEARHNKEQLSELTRTAADYSKMIQRKEEQIAALNKQLDVLKSEHEKASVEIMELRADIDNLDAQLSVEKEDHSVDIAALNKLSEERDELRGLLATKASEETRRSEVEKSKELELADLRSRTGHLHQELTELKQSSLENQNRAKLELDHVTRDHTSLQHSHNSLLDRERAAQSQLSKLQTQFSELEKAKRTLESELLSSRSRHHETEAQLADALRAKEVSSLLLAFVSLFSPATVSIRA